MEWLFGWYRLCTRSVLGYQRLWISYLSKLFTKISYTSLMYILKLLRSYLTTCRPYLYWDWVTSYFYWERTIQLSTNYIFRTILPKMRTSSPGRLKKIFRDLSIIRSERLVCRSQSRWVRCRQSTFVGICYIIVYVDTSLFWNKCDCLPSKLNWVIGIPELYSLLICDLSRQKRKHRTGCVRST